MPLSLSLCLATCIAAIAIEQFYRSFLFSTNSFWKQSFCWQLKERNKSHYLIFWVLSTFPKRAGCSLHQTVLPICSAMYLYYLLSIIFAIQWPWKWDAMSALRQLHPSLFPLKISSLPIDTNYSMGGYQVILYFCVLSFLPYIYMLNVVESRQSFILYISVYLCSLTQILKCNATILSIFILKMHIFMRHREPGSLRTIF